MAKAGVSQKKAIEVVAKSNEVKVGGKKIELKFTFNSFRYMEDFDVSVLDEIESKPFKIISTIQTLFTGAVNNNPKVIVRPDEIYEYLEKVVTDGDMMELLETLMTLLTESNFFKSLQQEKK